MPKLHPIRGRKRSHRPIFLQIWVATSGCWTVAAVALPSEHAGVWLSLLPGVLIAWGSNAAVRKFLGEDAVPRPSGLASVPTVFGLLSMAYVSGIVGFGDQAEAKAAITGILLAGYLGEHLIPYTVRKVIAAWNWVMHRVETHFRAAIREVLHEDVPKPLRRNRRSGGSGKHPQRPEIPPAARALAARIATGDAEAAELDQLLRLLSPATGTR